MFRVDRIRAVRADRRDVHAGARGHTRRGLQPAPRRPPGHRSSCPASASWVAESFPAESVEELPDGGQRVVLAVSETAWLERLLLRAGPGARVVDPPESVDIGPAAARRLLDRYRARDLRAGAECTRSPSRLVPPAPPVRGRMRAVEHHR